MMSRLSNVLSMLFYLNNKNDYTKIADIADNIEVSTREIRRYRDDLEMAGIFIEEKRGRAGGYRLTSKIHFALGLNQTQKLLLNLSVRNNTQVFSMLNQILNSVSKLKEDLILGAETIDDETLTKLVLVQRAIETQKKLEIHYQSIRYPEGVYQVDPYFIRYYYKRYYLVAHHNGILKTYDIRRIQSLFLQDEGFTIHQELWEKEKNNQSMGIYRSPYLIPCIIEVSGKMNHYLDSFFPHPLKLIQEGSPTSRYQFETYHLHESLYALLSLGSSVTVIEPEELRLMYVKETEVMKHKNSKKSD